MPFGSYDNGSDGKPLDWKYYHTTRYLGGGLAALIALPCLLKEETTAGIVFALAGAAIILTDPLCRRYGWAAAATLATSAVLGISYLAGSTGTTLGLETLALTGFAAKTAYDHGLHP